MLDDAILVFVRGLGALMITEDGTSHLGMKVLEDS